MVLEDAVQRLGDKDPHVRYQALKALTASPDAALSPEALAAIVKVCRTDKLPYNRLEAMVVLRRAWPEAAAVEATQERLKDEPWIAEACIKLLGELGDEAAHQVLIQTYLGTEQLDRKLRVVAAYMNAPQHHVFEFLKASKALESPDDKIRATVVALLGRIKNPTLKPVFFKALKDTNARVRANAIEGLQAICTGPELAKLLAAVVGDKNNRVRANAIKGLLDLGVRQAEGLLHEMAHHQNPRYRASAAWVLGEVGHKTGSGRTLLEKLAKDGDNNVSYRAEISGKRMAEARFPSKKIAVA